MLHALLATTMFFAQGLMCMSPVRIKSLQVYKFKFVVRIIYTFRCRT